MFRYFDGIEDLQQQTIERYFERFAPLFAIPDLGAGDLVDRVGRYVDARLALYEAIGPIARLARARAADVPRFAESLHDTAAGWPSRFAPTSHPSWSGGPRPPRRTWWA